MWIIPTLRKAIDTWAEIDRGPGSLGRLPAFLMVAQADDRSPPSRQALIDQTGIGDRGLEKLVAGNLIVACPVLGVAEHGNTHVYRIGDRGVEALGRLSDAMGDALLGGGLAPVVRRRRQPVEKT